MTMNKKLKTTLVFMTSVLFLASANAQEGRYITPSGNPTNVYFGDPHIHTRISADASLWGSTLGPEDTYRFGLGEEMTSFKGWKVKLTRPLDWMVISDHSDVWGFYERIADGDPYVMAEPEGVRWNQMVKEGNTRQVADEIIKAFGDETLPWDVSDPEMIAPGWKEEVEAAEKFNDPGNFTAFIAYEWTSNPMGDNLHRVVIYRDNADKTSDVLPFTSTGTTGSQDPEDLWKVLEAYEEKTGGQVLAIPHNGNWSSGLMFAETIYTYSPNRSTGKLLDESYVATRNRWEPLYEATQIKGDGEAHPFLSPDDEFADYETWDLGNLSFSKKVTEDMLQYEYARSGLKLGLKYQEQFGVNPFQFGMVGAGDSHTGLPGQEENNFMGKHASSEPDAERWKTPFRVADIGTQEGWSEVASGLTGIWATDNTRAALWDAMKRKEVYATTGSRILVRVFGGWDFKPGDDQRSDYVDLGYEKGVPMGGELHRDPAAAGQVYRGLAAAEAMQAKGPNFLVIALKDPIGGNLDRVQMIKGWLDSNGELHEQVYNIAWGDAEKRNMGPDGKIPPVGNTVDIPDASWTNSIGDVELSTVWQDPDFDSREQAFYYVRVLEIPTPRWTAYDAKRFGITMSEEVPMITQERAYTSPIWYIP
jgi:hypothetical protein